MNKLYKKGLLLSAVAMAACAMPSMASASTFDGVGLHTLTGTDLAFTAAAPLSGGATCTTADFVVDVIATDARVTNATFNHCTGTGSQAGTSVTVTATNFPWTVTPIGDGFTIDGIHLVNHFSNGAVVTLSGNLSGATVNNATHTAFWTNGLGLTATSLVPEVSASTTVTGHIVDDQGTLAVTT